MEITINIWWLIVAGFTLVMAGVGIGMTNMRESTPLERHNIKWLHGTDETRHGMSVGNYCTVLTDVGYFDIKSELVSGLVALGKNKQTSVVAITKRNPDTGRNIIVDVELSGS